MKSSEKRRAKKEAWFRAGVDALARTLPTAPEGLYCCPLCIFGFPSTAALTFEHVPPRSVGGKEVALTCLRCNHIAGATIDAALRRQRDIADFFAGMRSEPLRIELEVEGIGVPADAKFTKEHGFSIVGKPGLTNPVVGQQHWQVWEQWAAEPDASNPTFRLRFTDSRHHPRDAEIAYLRAAYITVFAVFGYRYILQSGLVVVRRQINDPRSQHIERFAVFIPSAPMSARFVGWITKPQSLRSIVVQIGQAVVFLPGVRGDGDIYARLRARRRWPPRFRDINLEFTPIAWPTMPTFRTDTSR